MTLVTQGHESLSTSHVSFLTPFCPREGGRRGGGAKKEEEEGADDKSSIVATTQCPVEPGSWILLGCHPESEESFKDAGRFPSFPEKIEVKSIS